MTELSPEAKALIDAARPHEGPPSAERDRVRRSLAASLAVGAGLGAATKASAATGAAGLAARGAVATSGSAPSAGGSAAGLAAAKAGAGAAGLAAKGGAAAATSFGTAAKFALSIAIVAAVGGGTTAAIRAGRPPSDAHPAPGVSGALPSTSGPAGNVGRAAESGAPPDGGHRAIAPADAQRGRGAEDARLAESYPRDHASASGDAAVGSASSRPRPDEVRGVVGRAPSAPNGGVLAPDSRAGAAGARTSSESDKVLPTPPRALLPAPTRPPPSAEGPTPTGSGPSASVAVAGGPAAPRSDAGQGSPAASAGKSPSALDGEVRQLLEVHRALSEGDGARALRLLDANDPVAGAALRDELRAARFLALCQLGRRDEANVEAARLLGASPHSPVASRVRKGCPPSEPR